MEENKNQPVERTPLLKDQNSLKITFYESLKLLDDCKKDISILIIMLTLGDFAFIIILSTFPLYLTEEWDLSDFDTGLLLGLFGLMIGIASTFTGILPIKLGHKPALIVSSLLIAAGMLVLAYVESIALIIVSIFTLVSSGVSLCTPIIVYIMKLYVHPEARLMANSLFSLAFLLSYLLASLVISVFWDLYSNDESAYRGIFVFSGGVGVVGSFLAFFLSKPKFIEEKKVEAQISYTEAFKNPKFAKYLWFLLLLTLNFGFSGIFVIALPVYMTREFGDDTDWATILFILSIVSVAALIGLTPFVFLVSNYFLIGIGTLIQGIAIAVLVLPPTYLRCGAASVIYGIGNIYLPRIFDYILEIAPFGHEGLYLSLSNFPAKGSLLLKGIMSGIFIAVFLPEDEDPQGEIIWAIVASTCILLSILYLALQNKLECFADEPDKENEE